ncbi:glycosyltransferase family 1 protein [soil metagenome]
MEWMSIATIRNASGRHPPGPANQLREYTNAPGRYRMPPAAPRSCRLRMRIGINAHKLSFEHGFRQAGTSRYIEALLQELPAVSAGDDIIAYTGTVPEDWLTQFPKSITWRQAQFATSWPPARILWEQTAGLGLGIRDRLDVLHSPLNIAPAAPGAPSVVTVHDIAFERFPSHYPGGQQRYLSMMTRLSTRQAAQVIAVSTTTRDDLIECYGIAPNRITVVPNGVEATFRRQTAEEIAAFRRANELPENYLLFVGTLQPRKNLDGLLRAYSHVASRIDWPLVVIGGEGWLYSPIHRLVRQLGLSNQVRFAGYVEPSELPTWYAAATIFVFPSHYEGFGLPVIEAMASGTPVITSTTSSLPEVAGDAALLVRPTSPVEIARAMLQLAEDEELGRELAGRGLDRARQYSWRRTAEETYAVYQRAGNRASEEQQAS